MSSIFIVQTDLKNILRDPSLWIILLVPVLLLFLLRLGYPALLDVWPDASQYAQLGLAMFCITGSVMPGIALAFAMLDEKDHNVDVVLQIMPISYQKITFYRLVMIYVFGVFTALLLIGFTGIFEGNIFQMILLSGLVAATAPVMTLIPAFFASNKIEGATITKLLNFLIILPLPAFLFPGTWSWFMMVFPSWWIYKAFENTQDLSVFTMAILGGLIIHSAAIAGVYMHVFTRKVFR
jgi:hypothetical protein